MGVNNEAETPQHDNISDLQAQKDSEAASDAKLNQELEDNLTVEEEHPELRASAEAVQQARQSFFGRKAAPLGKEKAVYSSVLREAPKAYDSLFCLSNVGVADPSRDDCYLELASV